MPLFPTSRLPISRLVLGSLALAVGTYGVALAQPALQRTPQGQGLSAQNRISCPLRVVPREARLADGATPQGFRLTFEGQGLSFLIGVGLQAGPQPEAAEIAPAASTAQRIDWSFREPPASVFLACRYEGGIVLTRAVPPTATSCSAAIRRSGPAGNGGWGLDSANLTCR